MNLEDLEARPYTLREVARITGLSLRSIELGCRRGTIQATTKGTGTEKRHWRMWPHQINELIAARTTGQTTPVQPPPPQPFDALAEARAATRRIQARRTRRRAA